MGSMAGLWFEYVWEDHVSTGLDHYVCSSFIALSDSDESVSQDFFVYNSMQFPAEPELHGLEILQKQKMGIDPFADEEADAELEAELAAAQEAGDAEAEEAAGQKLDDRAGGAFRLDDLQRDATFITWKMFWEPRKDESSPQRARAAIHREFSDDIENAGAEQVANWDKTVQIIDTDYHSYAMGMHCEERTGEDGSKQHTEDYFVWTREKQPSMYMRKRARDALLKEGLTEERIGHMNKGSIFECWGKDHHH